MCLTLQRLLITWNFVCTVHPPCSLVVAYLGLHVMDICSPHNLVHPQNHSLPWREGVRIHKLIKHKTEEVKHILIRKFFHHTHAHFLSVYFFGVFS